jgi:hypothetical protein
MAPEIEFYPSASNIDAWLEDHPDDPTAYANSAEALTFPNSHPSKRTINRKALGDITSNAMPEKRRRVSPPKAGVSLFQEPTNTSTVASNPIFHASR